MVFIFHHRRLFSVWCSYKIKTISQRVDLSLNWAKEFTARKTIHSEILQILKRDLASIRECDFTVFSQRKANRTEVNVRAQKSASTLKKKKSKCD